MSTEKIVCLAFATKKRHIAVDGHVLCEPKHRTAGYSVKNGQYNSLSLSGIPTNRKIHDDVDFINKMGKLAGTHPDGIIDFKPLDQQDTVIITRSICSKCLKRYNKLLEQQ